MQIGLILPTLDAHREEPLFLDQLGHQAAGDRLRAPYLGIVALQAPTRQGAIAPAIDVEIASEVADRTDTTRLRGQAAQLLHGRLARQAEFEGRRWNHPLGK